jgi:hypothetical protein
MFNVRLRIVKWEGTKVRGNIREANRRLTGSIAYDAQNEAKQLAAVDTGRMRGATTVVTPGSGFFVDRHATPEDFGKSRNEAIDQVEMKGDVATVEMGSYVPYAFIQEVLRGHRFIQPGLDNARANIPARIAQVGAEVGLR